MEKFVLSDKAIEKLNDDLNTFWGDTPSDAKAYLYSELAEASIQTVVWGEENTDAMQKVNNALYSMKMILDDIFS